jgi:uncharacterized membrane protein
VIQNPWLLFLSFAAVVAAVDGARKRPLLARAFRYLPVPFWCYFIPMLLSTAGVFPEASPLYPFLSTYLLPVCLPFLLLNVNLRSLAALGAPALLALAAGFAGIAAGAAASYAVLHERLPAESWKAVGALAGSWTGGSANMLSVKEALLTPDAVFAPVVVVDTFFAYGWMALLISLAGHQDKFDRWNLKGGLGPSLSSAVSGAAGTKGYFSARLPWVLVPAAAAGLGLACVFAGRRLPAVGSVISSAAWTILLVTTASLLLSFTGLFSEKAERTERWGTVILYILLVSLGARTNLGAIAAAPLFLAQGAGMLAVHGLVLFAAARAAGLPLFLLATASQACVGGAVSAPLVAAVFRPSLAPLGLLLAIAGNVAGTYAGIATAYLCRWIGGS